MPQSPLTSSLDALSNADNQGAEANQPASILPDVNPLNALLALLPVGQGLTTFFSGRARMGEPQLAQSGLALAAQGLSQYEQDESARAARELQKQQREEDRKVKTAEYILKPIENYRRALRGAEMMRSLGLPVPPPDDPRTNPGFLSLAQALGVPPEEITSPSTEGQFPRGLPATPGGQVGPGGGLGTTPGVFGQGGLSPGQSFTYDPATGEIKLTVDPSKAVSSGIALSAEERAQTQASRERYADNFRKYVGILSERYKQAGDPYYAQHAEENAASLLGGGNPQGFSSTPYPETVQKAIERKVILQGGTALEKYRQEEEQRSLQQKVNVQTLEDARREIRALKQITPVMDYIQSNGVIFAEALQKPGWNPIELKNAVTDYNDSISSQLQGLARSLQSTTGVLTEQDVEQVSKTFLNANKILIRGLMAGGNWKKALQDADNRIGNLETLLNAKLELKEKDIQNIQGFEKTTIPRISIPRLLQSTDVSGATVPSTPPSPSNLQLPAQPSAQPNKGKEGETQASQATPSASGEAPAPPPPMTPSTSGAAPAPAAASAGQPSDTTPLSVPSQKLQSTQSEKQGEKQAPAITPSEQQNRGTLKNKYNPKPKVPTAPPSPSRERLPAVPPSRNIPSDVLQYQQSVQSPNTQSTQDALKEHGTEISKQFMGDLARLPNVTQPEINALIKQIEAIRDPARERAQKYFNQASTSHGDAQLKLIERGNRINSQAFTDEQKALMTFFKKHPPSTPEEAVKIMGVFKQIYEPTPFKPNLRP